MTYCFKVLFTDPQTCSTAHFTCSGGMPKCIPQLWVCDGEQECADGSDEVKKLCNGGKKLIKNPTIQASKLKKIPFYR